MFFYGKQMVDLRKTWVILILNFFDKCYSTNGSDCGIIIFLEWLE